MGPEWQYKNIISPFTRLYIFTKGKGAVYMNKNRYELEENDLFIIPKFTSHTYECSDYNKHYYVCFFDELTIDQHGLFDSANLCYRLKATALDRQLMQRLIELNIHKRLPVLDPKKYDNRGENLPLNTINKGGDIATQIESKGILLQLLSRFLQNYNSDNSHRKIPSKERLSVIIHHINSNLDKRLTVGLLADMMCMSADNFTRVFKDVMGIPPSAYIQRARVERAQTLLLTTRFSVREVAESVGVPNISQFSTLFSKITNYTPKQYVKLHQNIDEIFANDQ